MYRTLHRMQTLGQLKGNARFRRLVTGPFAAGRFMQQAALFSPCCAHSGVEGRRCHTVMSAHRWHLCQGDA